MKNKLIRYFIMTLSSLLALGFGYLWLTFASPYNYNPPNNLPAIKEDKTYFVFVYGTLTKPWVRWLVMGRFIDSKPAELSGFRKEKLDIKPVSNAMTKGQIIKVSGDELKALDRYERLGIRYKRIKLTLKNGKSAWVYKLIKPIQP
jgi:gamma-glutamylcyclotransferase (GGCT)/AIG2-like uncharacterized protein YtfP